MVQVHERKTSQRVLRCALLPLCLVCHDNSSRPSGSRRFQGFENQFHGKTFAEQLRAVEVRRVVSDAKRDSGGSNFASLSGGQHRDVQAASHGCRPGRRKGPKAQKSLRILPCSMRSCPRGEWSLGLGQATWCTCGDLDEAGCFGVSFGTISCSCGFVLPNVEWHGRLKIGASSAEC